MRATNRQPLVSDGVPFRGPAPVRRGRVRTLLANAALIVLSGGVVIGLVMLNSASGQPAQPAQAGPTYFPVRLLNPANIGAVNRNLAHIGARVRVVPLERSCGLAGRAHRYRVSRIWRRELMAIQAPGGETTIVVSSPDGLTGVTFEVQGTAPLCLPVTGRLPYRL